MKVGLISVDVDFDKGDHFELDLPDPAIVRHTTICYVAESVLLGPKARMRAVFRMFIEVDPEGRVSRRRYRVLPCGQALETPHEIEYRACFVNPDNGRAIAIFEVTKLNVQALEPVATALPGPGESAS